MLGNLLSRLVDVGEIRTPSGRAIVEERYSALRKQVPVIYILAIANLCGVELATRGELNVGLNFPTMLALLAVGRMIQWLRASDHVSHHVMVKRLRQSCIFTAVLCVSVSAWCLYVAQGADANTRMAVLLFGGFTAIGTAYGLSPLPSAAKLPIFVLALPLALTALMSKDPQVVGAALSLALVAVLILRLLTIHNRHFAALIRSRTELAQQQALAESAHQQAVVAATTDFLTGLPNRRAFIAALDAEIERTGETFAVAILDLDNFKNINDTLGHPSGDKLLEVVADRLVAAAGAERVVARLGGDEFGILIRNVAGAAEARAVGAQILTTVERLAVVNDRQVAVAASIGIGLSRSGEARSPSQSLADADLALYEAKRSNDLHVAVFEPRMEAPYQRRAQVERRLRLPRVHERIHLVFQPILDLRTGRIVANEALARWNDEELGDISPSEFVPVAEQLNIIGDISDHLMRRAFAEASEWPETVALAFNLSAVQLCSPGSAEAVLQALRQAGLRNDRLQVEVTETALLADFERARHNLATLRAAGVTIVLDDFGAGYSSIGYLRELTFDQIKLDGALITAAQDTADGKRLLSAVIGLCQALGVDTVAEHIENEEQHRLVARLGCGAGQGFWLHAPMSAIETRELLAGGAMALQGLGGRGRIAAA